MVTIPLKLNEKQFANMPSTFSQEPLELKPNDVYLMKEDKLPGEKQQVPTWVLGFVLREPTKLFLQAICFGNVFKGLSAISNFAKTDDRSNYTFIVETK